MSDDQAIEILKETIEHHEEDWNFQDSLIVRLKLPVQGREAVGLDEESYSLEIRTDAALIRYSSPYSEVRAIADPHHDPHIPVETFRSYFLAIAWAVIGMTVNTFFVNRFPGIGIGSDVIQVLLYPCGKALEFILPDWGFTFKGIRHSLNPGPWTYKEQMFATITFDIEISSTLAYQNIIIQKLPMFYDNTWATFGYQIMLILSFQCIGFEYEGILRRFCIYPVKSLWPNILPTLAMNRALLAPEKQESANGWTISRYKFFFISFGAMFC